MNESRYRAKGIFCKRICGLCLIFKFTGVRHALPPDGISRCSDQASIIAGHLAGID